MTPTNKNALLEQGAVVKLTRLLLIARVAL